MLRNINVDNVILELFYKSIVQSIISFCIACWYGNLVSSDKNKLSKIIRSANKLGIKNVPSLSDLYQTNVKRLGLKIMLDELHPLHENYKLLRSGNRLDTVYVRTCRYRTSFIPASVRLLNNNNNYLKN